MVGMTITKRGLVKKGKREEKKKKGEVRKSKPKREKVNQKGKK